MRSRTITRCRHGLAPNNVAGIIGLVLLALTLLIMARHFAVYLRFALTAVQYPFELDYGEGIVWQQALLIPGSRMYGDIERFPFIVFHYPPVYHLAVRAVAAFGIDALLAGRSISLLSTLVIGGLAALLAFRVTREWAGRLASLAGAAVAALSFFCFWPVISWSPLMRVDMLAIALSFLGVWCSVLSPSRPWLLYCGMVAFVLAVFTKQTCIVAPLASMIVMLAAEPRRALQVCGFGLLLGGAALAALTWLTDGGFLRHILLYNLNRYDLTALLLALQGQLAHAVFGLLAVAGIVLGWKELAPGWSGLDSFRRALAGKGAARPLAILTLYALFSTGTLVTLGKTGAWVNYFIEWMAVLSVFIGILVGIIVRAGVLQAAYGVRWCEAVGCFVLLIIQVLYLPTAPRRSLVDPTRMQQQASLEARIRAADRPVLSDDMVLLLKAGKEVPWEPAIFAELASTGRWDERRIVDMIMAHDFAFIITQGHHGISYYDNRYTPAVQQAIEAAYPRIDDYGDRTVRLPPA